MKKIYILLLLFTLHFPCRSQHTFELLISTPFDEFVFNAIEDEQGNYIFIGEKGSYDTRYYDAYIIKTKPNGDTALSKTFFIADSNSMFVDILLDDDGQYLIFGKIGSRTSYNYEFFSIDDKEARDYVEEEIVGGYVNEYSIKIFRIGEQISFTCSD